MHAAAVTEQQHDQNLFCLFNSIHHQPMQALELFMIFKELLK